MKIFKLGKILNSIEELITSDEIMLFWTFTKITGRVLLMAHVFACLYWLIGEYESYAYVPNPWQVRVNQ